MNNKLSLALIISTTILLSACSDKPVNTVSYYKAHEKERIALIKECHNNPGQKTLDANCMNAEKADNIEDNKKEGTLPLLDVSKFK